MKLKFIPLVFLNLCLPASLFALGFRMPDGDAFATARGEAFVATADNPSAIFYNPAGITQIDGLAVRLGSYNITVNDKFSSHDITNNTITEVQAIPNFYATYKPDGSRFAFGLGTYSPYGLALRWHDDTPFRTLAKQGQLLYLCVNPVIAMEIVDGLSISIGPTFNYANISREQGIAMPGDNFKFEGDGTAFGFTAGVLWQPAPQHSFGISYRSATDVTFDGRTSIELTGAEIQGYKAFYGKVPFPVNENGTATIRFPQFIKAGYSFRPTPEWNLEADIDWTDWDSLNTVTLHKQTTGDTKLPFNWDSSFMFEFGCTRYFPCGIHVSGGYCYSMSSVSESAFNPGIPDSDRHIFSAGVGGKISKMTWDLAYQVSYGPPRSIQNGTAANGTYTFLSHAISLSMGYQF